MGPGKIMMAQFEVIGGLLTIIDTTRWDFFYGFRRVLKELK